MNKINVLLVDDDTILGTMVTDLLMLEKYTIMIAASGAEALELLKTLAPDLIILDLQMPVMDGWEFIRKYQAKSGPHASIVIMTAAFPSAEQLANTGVKEFLHKPFYVEELLEVMERYCQL